MKDAIVWVLLWALTAPVLAADTAEDGSAPMYKPSARFPTPVDIRTNVYGASRNAPNALGIGEKIPDFAVPRAGGGSIELATTRQSGPVVVIFYRGHW